MATTYTTNYNLGKQENHADKFDMDVITNNADKIDAALTAKADKSTTYTKTEVDTALSGKQATLTTAQLAAVNSGITSAGVEQIETNKNNILSLAALRTYRLPINDTSYSFTSLDGIDDTTRFKYALIVGGGTAATPTNALVWLLFISTDGACTITKIIGNGTQVLTGTVSGTTLNITASATIYGGLRLIWLG